MNLYPILGDQWTNPGDGSVLIVTQVTKSRVTLSMGSLKFSHPIPEYLALAEASQRKGHTLHRTETEYPMFE